MGGSPEELQSREMPLLPQLLPSRNKENNICMVSFGCFCCVQPVRPPEESCLLSGLPCGTRASRTGGATCSNRDIKEKLNSRETQGWE